MKLRKSKLSLRVRKAIAYSHKQSVDQARQVEASIYHIRKGSYVSPGIFLKV